MHTTTKHFDIDKVNEITCLQGKVDGDVIRCLLKPYQIKELLELGVINKDDSQNCSPTVEEFLSLANDTFEKSERTLSVLFQSYVVYPPRTDARVSIEGINVEGMPDETCIYLLYRVRQADELDVFKGDDGTWTATAWWD